MDCPKCGKPMIFFNVDERNGLKGYFKCISKECKSTNQ